MIFFIVSFFTIHIQVSVVKYNQQNERRGRRQETAGVLVLIYRKESD